MQRFSNVVAVALFILLLWSPNSFAAGVGFSFDGSLGSGDTEWDSSWDSVDFDSRSGGFGFVLDTSPTNERVFNYRLHIGYGFQELDHDDGLELDGNGVYIENIFGFAMVRNENFRWWAGPLVRVGYYAGDSNSIQAGPSASTRVDFDYGEFGIGAVTGMNFKSGGVVFSPSLGFRASAYGGEAEFRTRDSLGTWSETEDFDAGATTFFANIALLF